MQINDLLNNLEDSLTRLSIQRAEVIQKLAKVDALKSDLDYGKFIQPAHQELLTITCKDGPKNTDYYAELILWVLRNWVPEGGAEPTQIEALLNLILPVHPCLFKDGLWQLVEFGRAELTEGWKVKVVQ